jgi:hypothetical protein
MILLYYLLGDKEFLKHDGVRVNTFSYLKGVLFALLTFFPFYYLSRKGKILNKHLIVFFTIYSIITVFRFFYDELTTISFSLDSESVNNRAYDVLSLFPFVFLLRRKKILPFIMLLFYTSIIILSFKRGAILIALIAIFIYLTYYINTNKYKLSKFTVFIIVCIFVALTGYLIYYLYSANEFLQYRVLNLLEKGDSSNRDVLFSKIFEYWANSKNILNILFGYGLWSSIKIAGNAAHNDWLELLSNCGLLGVTLYLLLFFSLYSTFKKIVNKDLKYMLLMITIIWLLKTFFSMAFMEMNLAPLMMLLGYIYGNNELLILKTAASIQSLKGQ